MFFKHLEPLLKPFRAIRSKVFNVKTMKGNMKMDVQRVKTVKNYAQKGVGKHAGMAKKMGGKMPKGAKMPHRSTTGRPK